MRIDLNTQMHLITLELKRKCIKLLRVALLWAYHVCINTALHVGIIITVYQIDIHKSERISVYWKQFNPQYKSNSWHWTDSNCLLKCCYDYVHVNEHYTEAIRKLLLLELLYWHRIELILVKDIVSSAKLCGSRAYMVSNTNEIYSPIPSPCPIEHLL